MHNETDETRAVELLERRRAINRKAAQKSRKRQKDDAARIKKLYYEAQSANTKLMYEKRQVEKIHAELAARWRHHEATCPLILQHQQQQHQVLHLQHQQHVLNMAGLPAGVQRYLSAPADILQPRTLFATAATSSAAFQTKSVSRMKPNSVAFGLRNLGSDVNEAASTSAAAAVCHLDQYNMSRSFSCPVDSLQHESSMSKHRTGLSDSPLGIGTSSSSSSALTEDNQLISDSAYSAQLDDEVPADSRLRLPVVESFGSFSALGEGGAVDDSNSYQYESALLTTNAHETVAIGASFQVIGEPISVVDSTDVNDQLTTTFLNIESGESSTVLITSSDIIVDSSQVYGIAVSSPIHVGAQTETYCYTVESNDSGTQIVGSNMTSAVESIGTQVLPTCTTKTLQLLNDETVSENNAEQESTSIDDDHIPLHVRNMICDK